MIRSNKFNSEIALEDISSKKSVAVELRLTELLFFSHDEGLIVCCQGTDFEICEAVDLEVGFRFLYRHQETQKVFQEREKV